MAELQKDPITRGDFLGFGIIGAVMGAILTIPPVAFVLSPIIKTDVLGQSDVPDDWFEVGPVSEVPEGEPTNFVVEFPVNQIYSEEEIRTNPEHVQTEGETIDNAVWVSWQTKVLPDGSIGQSRRPGFIDGGGSLSPEQIREVTENLNVMSSSCAHLGCPVRWLVREGNGLFLCPCHGGLYDINGGYIGGPPPRGLYNFTFEVRENGMLYVKHEFDIEPGLNKQRPYVV
jgi:Rieske Fe-S protein